MVMQENISQFAEEAAFLWFLRTRVINEPHFSLDDLAGLDERLDAHLDGLRVAGEPGWDRCGESLYGGNPAEYFAPAVLAFESGIPERIQAVLDAVGNNPDKARALISALGWISCEQALSQLNMLLASESSFHRYVGIAACAIHRHDPGRHLDKSFDDSDVFLIARGIRAHGELARKIKVSSFRLKEYLTDDDDRIRFSTAWSASLAGIQEAMEVLKSFVTTNSSFREKALNTALRRMEPSSALIWQRQLAESQQTIRLAVIGAGIIGDPALVPWLLEQMKTPALSRVAGEAFTMITGVDIDREELRGRCPEGFCAGPNDEPDDDNVAMDVDDNLPWPDPESVMHWWSRNKGAFQNGTRHLVGKPISADHLRHVLGNGLQRQRAAAALELAILEPGRPLFEVRAPGFRQQEILRQKTEGRS